MQASQYALIAVVVLLTTITASAHAGDCCAHCGCQSSCSKVCRLVCEEKKVDIVCWGCQCEDFCLPGPSHRGSKHCEEVCESCDADPKTPYAKAKKFVWYDWTPACDATLHTKKKLMKKTITKKVPSYKWVVEDLCEQCDANCVGAEVQPGVPVPPPPVANAKLKYFEAATP